jgi:hypothetical protein
MRPLRLPRECDPYRNFTVGENPVIDCHLRWGPDQPSPDGG